MFRWRRPSGLPTLLLLLALSPVHLAAHVGSPDVFVDAIAGPYPIYITVRPPQVIPGVAEIEILTRSDDVRRVRIVPLPLSGPGAEFAPVPDEATRSREDPRMFTGTVWMMTAGAWQVRVAIDGDRGSGQVSVPVPTLPQATRTMPRSTGVLLFALMLVLSGGFISIVGAAVREGSIPPGESPRPNARWKGRLGAAIAAAIVLIVVTLGNKWWSVEAMNYAGYVYKPLAAELSAANGELTLTLHDPGWLPTRRTDDFVPDHGHLMHLFIVSPSLDRLWHLHPQERAQAVFTHQLPAMPAGAYQTFGDLIHATGLPETVVGAFDTTAVAGTPLGPDDSAWSAASGASSGNAAPLPDGGRIVWMRDASALVTKKLSVLTFRVEDAEGKPASDLELYMGMPGHAVIVRTDRQVFAHVHPSGTAPMATLQLAADSLKAGAGSQGAQDHSHYAALPPVVSFPYGFPLPGDYRIFVQVKRAGHVHTGAFDVAVQ